MNLPPPAAAAAAAACRRLFKRAMPGPGAQVAEPPASLRPEQSARPRAQRLTHPAPRGAAPSAGGCGLNLSSCICMNGWPFWSARERAGVLRKAAKWSESKVGRRASFRACRSPLPTSRHRVTHPGHDRFTIGFYPIVVQIHGRHHG